MRSHEEFWCSVILGNSTTLIRKLAYQFGFGAASFWVTAQLAERSLAARLSFGAASFWVTAQHGVRMYVRS